MKLHKCEFCDGLGKVWQVKDHYRSFCMLQQYEADKNMLEEFKCPFCQPDAPIYFLGFIIKKKKEDGDETEKDKKEEDDGT